MKNIIKKSCLVVVVWLLQSCLVANAALYHPDQTYSTGTIFTTPEVEKHGFEVFGFDYNKDAQVRPDTQIKQKIADLFKAGDVDGAIKLLEQIHVSSGDEKASRLLAMAYLQKGQTSKAKPIITGLFKQENKDPELYNLQGALNAAENDSKAAKQNYQKALALDKNSIPAYLGLAKLAVNERQLDAAKNYYNKVLVINDKYTNAYIMLAKIANQQDNHQEVERILKVAYNKVQGDLDDSVKIGVVLGKYYARQKQPEKILQLAQKITKQHPDKVLALSFLAQAQIANKEKRQLEITLKKILKLSKKNTEYRLLLAKLLASKGETKEGIRILDEIISIHPTNALAYILKIEYLIILKDTKQAFFVIAELEKKFPMNYGLAKQLKGDVYVSEKQFTDAIAQYKKAYEIKPENMLLFKTVAVMIANGEQQKATQWLKKQVENDKTNTTARIRLASAYEQSQSPQLAIEQYEILLQQEPDHVLALNNLAWLYYQKNSSKALAIARRAYEQVPNNASIADTYGAILIAQGQDKRGLQVLQHASELNPDSLEISFHLAQGLVANAEKEKAVEQLNKIKKSKQVFEERDMALALLKKLTEK